jgi:antitoxin MazE
MKTRIVQIGNSQGIRIPKPLLAEAGLSGEVEIKLRNRMLIIQSVSRPRAGWAAAFRAMADRGDDVLLDAAPATNWDQEAWEW